MKIHGVRLSPYVRKVLVVLELKALAYEQIDVFPGAMPPEYLMLSPLGKIPALEDGDVKLCDSSVICEYLEEQYPACTTMPASPADRARARWLEEYADTRLIELCGGGIFLERIVKPMFFKQEMDVEKVAKTIETLLPPVLDYLESQVPAENFLFGSFGKGDISLVSPFINAGYADYHVDAGRWPKFAAFIERVKAQPVVAKLLQKEAKILASFAKK